MTKHIPLTQGQHALVDDEDYTRVMQHKWVARRDHGGKFYAFNMQRGQLLPLANYVLDVPRGVVVDHINREPLDNRRVNLRLATSTLQNRNRNKFIGDYTSQHVGVSYNKHKRRWCAAIYLGRKHYLQRTFKTEQEAITQRKLWEQEFNWPVGKQSTEE